ncbi:hypothetical protein IE81DRAFT_223644 [Ceraceosorus guamensis]|uniref:Uncharacterized protein n=1 Tax=Ceraceosorus guamensis TaxID=1522189 RepID=A0A316WBK3_9BASI|nr:hypothetical protein IE81DRAFT_223644 [Ceraceosorus guamensis]PWN44955.1 hypothetical protein IE81DRAFT_223644 [Ceraceosorus guamensis]
MFPELHVETSKSGSAANGCSISGTDATPTNKTATRIAASSRGGSSPSERGNKGSSSGLQPLFASPTSPLASNSYPSPRPQSSTSRSGSAHPKSRPLVVTYSALRNFDRAQSGEIGRESAPSPLPSGHRIVMDGGSLPSQANVANRSGPKMRYNVVARIVAAMAMVVGAVCNVVLFGPHLRPLVIAAVLLAVSCCTFVMEVLPRRTSKRIIQAHCSTLNSPIGTAIVYAALTLLMCDIPQPRQQGAGPGGPPEYVPYVLYSATAIVGLVSVSFGLSGAWKACKPQPRLCRGIGSHQQCLPSTLEQCDDYDDDPSLVHDPHYRPDFLPASAPSFVSRHGPSASFARSKTSARPTGRSLGAYDSEKTSAAVKSASVVELTRAHRGPSRPQTAESGRTLSDCSRHMDPRWDVVDAGASKQCADQRNHLGSNDLKSAPADIRSYEAYPDGAKRHTLARPRTAPSKPQSEIMSGMDAGHQVLKRRSQEIMARTSVSDGGDGRSLRSVTTTHSAHFRALSVDKAQQDHGASHAGTEENQEVMRNSICSRPEVDARDSRSSFSGIVHSRNSSFSSAKESLGDSLPRLAQNNESKSTLASIFKRTKRGCAESCQPQAETESVVEQLEEQMPSKTSPNNGASSTHTHPAVLDYFKRSSAEARRSLHQATQETSLDHNLEKRSQSSVRRTGSRRRVVDVPGIGTIELSSDSESELSSYSADKDDTLLAVSRRLHSAAQDAEGNSIEEIENDASTLPDLDESTECSISDTTKSPTGAEVSQQGKGGQPAEGDDHASNESTQGHKATPFKLSIPVAGTAEAEVLMSTISQEIQTGETFVPSQSSIASMSVSGEILQRQRSISSAKYKWQSKTTGLDDESAAAVAAMKRRKELKIQRGVVRALSGRQKELAHTDDEDAP